MKYVCEKCKEEKCVYDSEAGALPKYCPNYCNYVAKWQEVEDSSAWKEIPQNIKDGIKEEYDRAVVKHPEYPTDPFHAMTIITEELGEAVQGLNNLKDHNVGCIEDVIIELDHTVVTAIRTIKMLSESEK
jgi:hypothetical protein